jgi:hypothetical protein
LAPEADDSPPREAYGRLMLAVPLYITALAAFALQLAHPATLASSPIGVAHGHLLQLFSSGLVIDGPPLPQIAALTGTLLIATRRLGARLTWTAAIGAHLGATLVAYAFVVILWLADPNLSRPVIAAPDYGISVIFVGVCGAAAQLRRPAAVAPVLTGLTAVWLIWWWLSGAFSPIVLANLEHLLGFAIGVGLALFGRSRQRSAGDTSRCPSIVEQTTRGATRAG